MTWRAWHFKNAMVHMIENDELGAHVLDDLTRRGCPLYPQSELPSILVQGKAVDELYLDMGGMIYQDEPRERFLWCGMPTIVRSAHVDGILEAARKLPPRWFGAMIDQALAGAALPYFKLKIWHFAFVMTRPTHTELVRELAAIAPVATQHSEDYAALLDRRETEANQTKLSRELRALGIRDLVTPADVARAELDQVGPEDD